MKNAAVEAAGPQTEKFLVPLGRYFGYLVIGLAVVLSVVAIAGEGTASRGLVAFCVAFALLSWVVLIRPQVAAHRYGLVLQNMLRDTFLPWSCIKSCRVAQTLQIGTRDKVYHGLGVSRSARQYAREMRQSRRQEPIGPNTGMSRLEFPPSAALDATDVNLANQEHTVRSNFTHTERRIETLVTERSAESAGREPLVVWSPLPVGALVLAGLAVVLAVVL